MIIHPPTTVRIGQRVRLQAKIDVETRPEWSTTLWYEYSDKFINQLATDRCDAFAAAVFIFAMAIGEDMEVRGTVSPKLVAGLRRYQEIFRGWFPEIFCASRPVDIKVSRLEPDTVSFQAPSATALSFSGGVDSFYSLFDHLPSASGASLPNLKYLVFILGLDIMNDKSAAYWEAAASYDQVASSFGLELLKISTNYRDMAMIQSVPLLLVCSASIAAAFLPLRALASRYVIPSSMQVDEKLPSGTHWEIDVLFSTETLTFVHDDSQPTRVDKTRRLVREPITYGNLRVCWAVPAGLINCGRCPKCVRTSTTLDLLGALDKYSTFPYPRLKNLRLWFLKGDSCEGYAKEIVQLAEEVGRKDVADDIREAISRSRRAMRRVYFVLKLFRLRGPLAQFIANRIVFLHHPIAWRKPGITM